ncbi:MAG TPA: BON domain-containing protein [Vicinamibacterales bacterium]|jgi:hyperosmotically inducible periplasmic protein|nr:BON domain-containing protein [Vicinamibacterales bacterium]
MSFRTWVAALALGALTVAPAASAQTSTAAKVDDSTIKSRVETRLKNDATLKGDNIVVSVDKGVVTLSGTVHSNAQKDRAKELAKVSGVTDVDSKLEVESTGPSTVDKAEAKTKDAAKATKDATKDAGKATKDATVKGAEKTKDAAAKTGEKTKDAVATTGEVINDAWITSKVSADFVNEDTLKGSDINVDTKDHVVTLKGTVVSAAGKARAEEIAKTTKGVKRVVNTLTIGPKK